MGECYRKRQRGQGAHCNILTQIVQDPEDKHFMVRMTDSFSFRNHLCIVTALEHQPLRAYQSKPLCWLLNSSHQEVYHPDAGFPAVDEITQDRSL